MEFIWNFPLFTIVLSLFSGVLCTILSAKAAKRYTLCLEGVLMALVACVLWRTFSQGQAFTYVMGEFPAPWGNEIRAGLLEALIALVFLAILFCAVMAGSIFLWDDLDESKINLYYSLVNLMTAALMAMTWTNDIFTGYVFLEILTLTSCGSLIVREMGRTTLAAMRYMLLNLLGSGLFLLGVVLLYDTTGHLLMVNMQQAIAELAANPAHLPALSVSVGILTVGLSIKSGLFPFHYWMPDTYGRATPTSAAILSSLVSKCYIFLLIKIYYRSIGIGVMNRLPIGHILFVLGIGGIVFGSISALRAQNINGMVAFSSAAQIGYIFMGIGMGGSWGYTAALFHILAHAVTKSQLFLTTPRLAVVSGGSLLFRRLTGSALRDRQAGRFFTVGAFSMIGIPVFAGFASKILFGTAAVESGNTGVMLAAMLALAASTLLNAMYFIRTLIRIYTHPRADGMQEEASGAGSFFQTGAGVGQAEGMVRPIRAYRGPSYSLPMFILTAVNLFLGLFSWVAVDLIRQGLEMFG